MNWKRLATGGVLAAVTLWLFDAGNLILTQRLLAAEPDLSWGELAPIAGSLAAPSLVIGFLLSWLYVLARPRLGPGPKTAILTGTAGFFFANSHFIGVSSWISDPGAASIQFVTLWMKFVVATSLAGWQSIEKAP